MTSATKPEVEHITYRNAARRSTKPRPQVKRTKNLAKFDDVVFEICWRTDTQTNRLISIFRTHPGSEVVRTKSNTTNPLIASTLLATQRCVSWDGSTVAAASCCCCTVKNIRISTDILWRVMWTRASLFRRFTDTNVHGTSSVKIRKTRHKISVDMRIFFYSVVR